MSVITKTIATGFRNWCDVRISQLQILHNRNIFRKKYIVTIEKYIQRSLFAQRLICTQLLAY